MKIKDRILLTAASFALGWLLVDATTMSMSSTRPNSTLVIDTIKPVKPQTIIQDVRGKKALFIGDSHTANHGYGWQV
jgi:predicted GTPase